MKNKNNPTMRNLKDMGCNDKFLEFGVSLRKNAFNKDSYKVNSFGGLRRFKSFIEDYIGTEGIGKATPQFQRDNDKWSLLQKQRFVLNVLKGVETTILLMTIKESTEHYILDGLQRTTALYEFIDGKFTLEDGISFREIKENNLDKVSQFRVALKVYDFDSVVEAVKFYIEMNEGITHSSQDIERAKKYMKKEAHILDNNSYIIKEILEFQKEKNEFLLDKCGVQLIKPSLQLTEKDLTPQNIEKIKEFFQPRGRLGASGCLHCNIFFYDYYNCSKCPIAKDDDDMCDNEDSTFNLIREITADTMPELKELGKKLRRALDIHKTT